MIIMSIDAATYSTGIAIFNNQTLIHQECIQATSSDVIKRIVFVSQRILSIAKEYNPTDIVIQDPLPQEVSHNQATYKALMYLQAAAAIKLHQSGYTNITFCVSSHWRKLVNIKTGRGIKRQALKSASVALVKAQYNMQVNDDIADAINMGRAYYLQNGSCF